MNIPDRLFPEVVLDTEVGLVVIERATAPVCTTESYATELQLQAEQPVGLMLAAAVGQPGGATDQVNLRIDLVEGQDLGVEYGSIGWEDHADVGCQCRPRTARGCQRQSPAKHHGVTVE